MKNISFTQIAIWATLLITAKLYVYDLPIIFKCLSHIERSKIETDSIQTSMIVNLVDGHNVIVDALNTVIKTAEEEI